MCVCVPHSIHLHCRAIVPAGMVMVTSNLPTFRPRSRQANPWGVISLSVAMRSELFQDPTDWPHGADKLSGLDRQLDTLQCEICTQVGDNREESRE